MNTKNYPVILYGTGDNGRSALALLRSRGIEPAAFCSRSVRGGGAYCGLLALSREQVKEKYGNNFRLWITPYYPTRGEIEHELLKIGFVDESMIMNPLSAGGEEEYLSCADLRTVAVLGHNRIEVCCRVLDALNSPPHVSFSPKRPEGYSSDVEYYRTVVREFLDYKSRLIEELRKGKPCVCDGCPSLKKARWSDITGRVEKFAIGLPLPCQLSCIYCGWGSNARNHDRALIEEGKQMNLAAMVQAMEAEGMQLNYPVTLGSGEISINPKKREILNSLSKYPLLILSNCVIYDDQIADLLARDDGSYLNVSLDAGTRETYHKVKGMDVFEKVLDSIRRYKGRGAKIIAKYILLPENCSTADMDGFLNVCADIGVNKVIISRDILKKNEDIPREIIEGAVYMANQAKEKRLRCELAQEVRILFTPEDAARI